MKKTSLLLILALLLSMISCSSIVGNDTQNNYENEDNESPSNGESQDDPDISDVQSSPCSHIWLSPTCTNPKTCSKCQKTLGVALGHTTDVGVCDRCGENFSTWEIGEYTDEFKQPTGKKYMVAAVYGTFSNSATTNSTLYAALQIDRDNIGIMLAEYGNHFVKGIFDYEYYNITILDEAGSKHSFTGTIYEGSTRIYFKDSDRARVISLLSGNDTVKIYLKSTKYSISTYLFDIDSKGFDTTYNLIK